MKLTGHKTEAVYRRYAIVAEADLSEGVGKLAALHAAQAGAQADPPAGRSSRADAPRGHGRVIPLPPRAGTRSPTR